MTKHTAKEIEGLTAGAWVMGCFLIMLGLLFSGGSGEAVSRTTAHALGRQIGEGMAHAACIEARGDWEFGRCDHD